MEAVDKQIYLTEQARDRLSDLLGSGRASNSKLETLRKRVQLATIVSPENMPGGRITIGSRFRLKDLDTGDIMEYALVLPKRAKLEQGYVSVLAPIGAQLLGAKESDVITFKTPMSTRRLRIEHVYMQAAAPLTAAF